MFLKIRNLNNKEGKAISFRRLVLYKGIPEVKKAS